MNPSDTISKHLPELKSRYKIRKIGVFGSYIKGQEQPASDVDILVSFEESVDIFAFIELKEYLESILDRNVDLVTEKALKPAMKENILREVRYL